MDCKRQHVFHRAFRTDGFALLGFLNKRWVWWGKNTSYDISDTSFINLNRFLLHSTYCNYQANIPAGTNMWYKCVLAMPVHLLRVSEFQALLAFQHLFNTCLNGFYWSSARTYVCLVSYYKRSSKKCHTNREQFWEVFLRFVIFCRSYNVAPQTHDFAC